MAELGTREQRARQWIAEITAIPERCASTAAERETAQRVAGWMRALGFANVVLLDVPGLPRSGLVLAIHAAVALLGCLWGGLPGTALAALAAWSFTQEFGERRLLLSRLFPAVGPSVNVVGRFGSAEPSRRVVLSAHIDAAQAGLLFSAPLADFFARLSTGRREPNRPPAGPLALPKAFLLAAVVLGAGAWLGAHGFLFTLATLITCLGLVLAVGLGVQWAFSAATPGANDNASAVAAMLLCAEKLMPGLAPDTELVVAGTGAEEVGCNGMHALMRDLGPLPRESTFFVNFECVGGGTLHYIRSEGVLGKTLFPPTLIELARRIAASGRFGEITATDLLAGTDGHVPAEHGYPALSLISLEANGVPRNYHRREDTVDAIDLPTVVRAADFGAAVAIAAIAGHTGPLTI